MFKELTEELLDLDVTVRGYGTTAFYAKNEECCSLACCCCCCGN